MIWSHEFLFENSNIKENSLRFKTLLLQVSTSFSRTSPQCGCSALDSTSMNTREQSTQLYSSLFHVLFLKSSLPSYFVLLATMFEIHRGSPACTNQLAPLLLYEDANRRARSKPVSARSCVKQCRLFHNTNPNKPAQHSEHYRSLPVRLLPP